MKKYHDNIKKRISKLNEVQKKIVESIDGPVMAIAGPGTGKTEVLAARVAHILSFGSFAVNPQNILCVTYTDAGVVAMRKRLISVVGPIAYKVSIHTFHSFCNEIIQQNLDYFSSRDLSVISDLKRYQIVESIVAKIDVNNILFRSNDGGFMVKKLISLFSVMKDEDFDLESIKTMVDTYLKDLPNRPEFIYKVNSRGNKKGDLKLDKFKREEKAMNELIAGAKLFDKYKKLCDTNGVYDYSDMLKWVLNAFNTDDDFLAQFQDQYMYICVDEFQDTNSVQKGILDRLISYDDSPNLFIVGDDDQSIYRFQGANLRNILDFYNAYKNNIQYYAMINNYRSSKNVLDASCGIIKNNKERLVNVIDDLNKELIASNDLYASSFASPKVVEYCNPFHESIAIIEEINSLSEQGEDLSDVAIMYYKHSQAEYIIKLLEADNINYSIKKSSNILEDNIVKSLLKVLEFIDNIDESYIGSDQLLFFIMHLPFFDIQERDILSLYKQMNVYKKKLKNGDIDTLPAASALEVLIDPDLTSEIPGLKSKEAMINFGKMICTWRKNSFFMPLLEQIQIIYTDAGILDYISRHENRIHMMQCVNKFFEFVKQEVQEMKSVKIGVFIDRVKQMNNYNISVPFEKIVFAKKGVNLISAHSSKGLEFKHVFLIGVQQKVWDRGLGNRFSFKFPDLVHDNDNSDDLEERRRLFFVVMTRAREYLHISYYSSKNNKDCLPSQFVTELLEFDIEVEKISLDDDKIFNDCMKLLQAPVVRMSNKLIDKSYIDEYLKELCLSVSDLNLYLDCPIKFYFEKIIKVPQTANESMAFGVAIHYALEKFFYSIKKTRIIPKKEVLMELFAHSMKKNRYAFSDERWVIKSDYGNKILSEYYDKYNNTWDHNIILEYRTKIAYEGIYLKGVADKIKMMPDGSIEVVDYKTGSFSGSKSKKRFDPPSDKNEYGGNYWRQIVFYKLILDNDKRMPYIVNSGSIDFVELDIKTNEFHVQDIAVSNEDVDILKKQIKEIRAKMQNYEFYHGCDESYCEYCKFVRDNSYKF